VHLRAPAVYVLESTLQLGANDSGLSPDAIVVWAKLAGDEGEAVISAGSPVTGWQAFAVPTAPGRPAFRATVDPSAPPFAQLFTSGVWRQRARVPRIRPADARSRGLAGNSTLFWSEPLVPCAATADGSCPQGDASGFRFAPGAGFDPGWYALRNVSLLAFHAWTADWARIESIDAANGTLLFRRPTKAPVGDYAKYGGRRVVVENVLEGLDEEGEWYWDPARGGTLTYLATAAEAAAIAAGRAPDDVLAAFRPRLDAALVLDGARHVSFANVTVAHARDGGPEAVERAYYVTAAAVRVGASDGVSLDGVLVRNCGASGVLLVGGVSNFAFSRGAVASVGGEGLSFSTQASDAVSCHISDSVFNDTGRVFLSQPGIVRLRGASGIVLERCLVSHGPYGGVLIGWQPGSASPGPDGPVDPVFTVRGNRVSDFGLGVLSDFGGVYVSTSNNTCWLRRTCAVPTLVEGNWIGGGRDYSYGSNGVYADEQAAALNVTGNVIEDVGGACVYHHCGGAQHGSNNIVARCGRQRGGSYLKSCNSGGNPTWPRLPHGFTSLRNVWVVDSAGGAPLTSDSDYRGTDIDDNVYWQEGGGGAALLTFPGGRTLAEWQRTGNDTRSVVADPLVADIDGGNFTLLPGSPALERGFRQINQAVIGPPAGVLRGLLARLGPR